MIAKLHIERAPKGWADSLRVYDVIVNEEKRAELCPGEKRTIEIESGPVEVYLKLESGKSRAITLNVQPGGEARLRCRPGSPLTALYRITLGRNRYMRLEVVNDERPVVPDG